MFTLKKEKESLKLVNWFWGPSTVYFFFLILFNLILSIE